MKTFEEIIKQEPVFLHNWKHKNDVIADFEGLSITNDEYEATIYHLSI